VPDARETQLLKELQARDERLAELEKENALLRQKIDLLVRKVFGASSEKLDPGQLLLLLQGTEQPPGKAPEPVAAEAPRRSTGQSPPRERAPRLPEHLPVVEEVIDPEPVKACPEAWRRIGEEVSERLDYQPARFLRLRTPAMSVWTEHARGDGPAEVMPGDSVLVTRPWGAVAVAGVK